MNIAAQPQVTTKELVDACALDDDLFARTFFAKATRQKAPPMHAAVDEVLNDPRVRLANLLLPRDFAKTTKLRIFTAKRIAYGLSRTILYVAASELKATQNIVWLRSRIESQMDGTGAWVAPFFSQVYGLKKGKKWTETELEVQHTLFQQPIWILGIGITSESVRGINFDDYRPDLVVLDDILTDENGSSKEQREKINSIVIGAVKNSLAPAADAPNAKLAMLNTPQHPEDCTALAEKDPEFKTLRFSCWTPETQDFPDDQQVSAWEERHPTPVLRQEKVAATVANRLSSFIREKECRIVAKENCMFRSDWLQFYGDAELPRSGLTVLAIDPVPPPTPAMERKRDVLTTDFEVQGVWRRYNNNFYLLEEVEMRGHQPSWSVAKFFELANRWRINWASIEAVAAQKYLKYILEQEMTRRQQWFTINLFEDIRSKPVRINSILTTPAASGRIFVRSEHTQFIKQFSEYPNIDHEDHLDMASIGVSALSKPWMDVVDDKGVIDNSDVPKLRLVRGCP